MARCLLNKQNGEAHGRVFQEIFKAVNEQHSDFNKGERIEGITVDFSDAEANGLKEPLGKEMASRVLRGCKVILAILKWFLAIHSIYQIEWILFQT